MEQSASKKKCPGDLGTIIDDRNDCLNLRDCLIIASTDADIVMLILATPDGALLREIYVRLKILSVAE